MGVPPNGWLIRENMVKINDLGAPPFMETPICQDICQRIFEEDTRTIADIWTSLETAQQPCKLVVQKKWPSIGGYQNLENQGWFPGTDFKMLKFLTNVYRCEFSNVALETILVDLPRMPGTPKPSGATNQAGNQAGKCLQFWSFTTSFKYLGLHF